MSILDEFAPGDRVRVVLEGVVTGGGNVALFSNGEHDRIITSPGVLTEAVSIEKIGGTVPPRPGTLFMQDGRPYFVTEKGIWGWTGSYLYELHDLVGGDIEVIYEPS